MDKKLPSLNPVPPNQVINFKTHTYWGVSNPARFQVLLEEAMGLVASGAFLSDNLFTWSRNNSALEDQNFLKAWQQNICNPADEAIVWRRYILACAAYHCIHINGDFVECGVYLGTGIKTVIDYLGGKEFPKTFWGYDTFDYNPVEGHAPFAEQKPGLFQQVKQRFQDYPQVKLIPGLIPQSFEGNQPEKISFLHIDLNQLKAELNVLEHFFNKVESGGIILLDDYEWSGIYRSQKIGESEWFDKLQYRIFPLPTGQGLVIKR